LRTTSRSWAIGARISSVIRVLPGQNSRSPSEIRRRSASVRLSTLTSPWTTTATSRVRGWAPLEAVKAKTHESAESIRTIAAQHPARMSIKT
jgi:hypothetical protein